MHATVRISRWIVRITGLLQVVVGVLIWTRRAPTWIPLHMLVGLVLVLALLTLGGLALRGGLHIGIVLGTFALCFALPWLGMVQAGLLVGPLHWIVQVVHLLLGLGAIRVGEKVAAMLLSDTAAGASAGSGAGAARSA